MDQSFKDIMGYQSPLSTGFFDSSSESEDAPAITTSDKAFLDSVAAEDKAMRQAAKEEKGFKELGLTKEELAALYETDGHYSTVYLLCLMLGLHDEFAKELATATEAPDTTIHSQTRFELNDTWSEIGPQKEIHSLTGGFHGIEEFFTAIRFLYTPNENMEQLGNLLHRFGDTYAHTELNNLRPEDVKEDQNLKDADPQTIDQYIKSWKIKSEKGLKSTVEPWVKFFNYYLQQDGFAFLDNEEKQKDIFHGRTLKEVLYRIYLQNDSKDYIMYGGLEKWEHALTDGSYPDLIYVRPNWYRLYVQNLAWLLATKYQLPLSLLDMKTFDRMISFVTKECCSMKGIIDYEIAKMLKKDTIYVPVYFADGRAFAEADAQMNDYLKTAQDVVESTKKYLLEQGIPLNKISLFQIFVNKTSYSVGFDYYMHIDAEVEKDIHAYKIVIEK